MAYEIDDPSHLSRMLEKWFLVKHKGRLKGSWGEAGAVLVEKCESLTAPQPRKFPPMPLWKNLGWGQGPLPLTLALWIDS